MNVNVTVRSSIIPTSRMKQIGSLFDCPIEQKLERNWSLDAPIETRNWKIGLIVGPSGCGKSTIANHMFGAPFVAKWGDSLIDSFENRCVEEIAAAFSSVGLNTIPAWLRNRNTLSNGEGFRADIANAMLTVTDGPIVIDEFTSVVDRAVAKATSHCVQRYVRQKEKQFIAISCHDDIVDWLQPDWIIYPDLQKFEWRSPRPRPKIEIEIKRCERSAWESFRHYHYMMSTLPNGPCFGAFIDGKQVAFLGISWLPISSGPRRGELSYRVSRIVTLPDWQGVGIGRELVATVAQAYAGRGFALRNTPAHFSYVRAHAKSSNWKLISKPSTDSIAGKKMGNKGVLRNHVQRTCHVFEWCGKRAMNVDLFLDGAIHD